MNKIEQTLWALTISTMLLAWWEKVLANEEIISTTESPTWLVTFQFKDKTMWVLEEWTKQNSQNIIMVDLVNPDEIQIPVEELIAQHQEMWAEQQKKDLIKFWGLVSWLSLWLWWIITYLNSLKSKSSNKVNKE